MQAEYGGDATHSDSLEGQVPIAKLPLVGIPGSGSQFTKFQIDLSREYLMFRAHIQNIKCMKMCHQNSPQFCIPGTAYKFRKYIFTDQYAYKIMKFFSVKIRSYDAISYIF